VLRCVLLLLLLLPVMMVPVVLEMAMGDGGDVKGCPYVALFAVGAFAAGAA
jgi:hypothetical protein